jgi:hypothetical protein
MYPEDFECDEKVRLMDLGALGLLVKCLNHAWVNDGLPQETDKILSMFGPTRDKERASKWQKVQQEFARLWQQVEPHFPIAADGRRRNPRQERERKKAVAVHEAAVKAAKARWNGNADAMRTHMQPQMRSQCQAEADTDIEKYSTGEEGRKEEEYTTARANGLPPPPPTGPNPPAEAPPSGLTPFEQIIWQASRDMILPAHYVENEYGRREPNPVWEAFAKSMRYAEPRIRRAHDPVTYARHVIQQELRALGFAAAQKAATVNP